MTAPRRILVLHTGGTLGMSAGDDGLLRPVPGLLEQELVRVPRFHDPAEPRLTLPDDGSGRRVHYEVRELAPLLDSSNMGMTEWVRVARTIEEEAGSFDAFVVIHGTDTMAYAASALSFMLVNLDRPVILTGSQIPFAHVRNDAQENLLGALTLAARYDIPEVGLYFRDRLLRGNRATKVDASGLDAFQSGNLRALVEVGVDIDVAWDLVRLPSNERLHVRPIGDAHVACVRLFPGMTADTLDRLLRPPLQGVALMSYGAGNAPDRDPAFLDVLRRATREGIVVVNTTQCLRGTVTPGYAAGHALTDAGVVSGLDMTAEAALTKLAYLLTQPDVPHDQVGRFMSVDLRGELTPPTTEARPSFREQRFVRGVATVLGETTHADVSRAIYPTLLCAAARDGDLDTIARMLADGAGLDTPDPSGRTPLHVAAAHGRAEVVTWLLARGVDPRTLDAEGRTAHELAADAGHPRVAAMLPSPA